jgi:hypothetical protein
MCDRIWLRTSTCLSTRLKSGISPPHGKVGFNLVKALLMTVIFS